MHVLHVLMSADSQNLIIQTKSIEMRSILLSFLILRLSIVTLSQERPTSGAIHGRVVSVTTKEPLFGVNVVVVGTNRGSSTDLEGMFKIPGLEPGTYILRVSSVGYEAKLQSDVVVNATRPTEVLVELMDMELQVEGVEVTANYFQKLPDKPVSTLTQSNEEIRRLPGGLEDVVRAISILPGVAQVQNGRNDLIVRGGSPSENLYVIDNIEVPNINHFGTQGASGGPLSYVNLDFVRETSFSTGGFGTRYGDRLSSVLTIDLREGNDNAIGGKATISASQFGLNLEGPAAGNGTFLFSARRSYLDFIFKAAGFGFVPEYWDFLGKYTVRVSPRDEISLLGIAALDNVRWINTTEDQRYENSRVLGSDQNQIVTGAAWKHLFPSGFTTLTVSRVDVGFEFLQSDSLLNPIFTNDSREVETTVRGDVVYQITKGTELSAGFSSRSVAFRSAIDLRPVATTIGPMTGFTATLRTGAWKGAMYGQLMHRFADTRITFGLRGDYFDLIGSGLTVSPRFSISQALLPTLNISASVGRYFQTPSYVWLVSNPANRNLTPARVDQFILGADLMLREDTKASIEVYRKNYGSYPASTTRTYFVMSNTGSGFGGATDGFASFGIEPLVNGGRGNAQGVELLLQKKLSEVPCYGTVSVSYNTSEFAGLDGVFRPGSFDQRWIVNLGGGYIFNERWEVSTKFRLATGRPYSPFLAGGAIDAVRYNTLRVGTNHSLDLRVDRRWQFDRWNLIAYIDIQNIYNRQPNDVPQFDQRTQRAEVNESIGLLPSIGISAEF